MQKNDLIPMTCESLGASLEGVCHHEGMAVFVPGMLPGEQGDVRITKVQPRFAFGRLIGAPRNPSPERVAVDCTAYPRCGGCASRHMSYQASLQAKREQVLNCFRRIGHLEVEVSPVIGMADPYHYRNKTAMPIGGTAEAPVAGFYAPRSHTLIPAAHCLNAMAPTADLVDAMLGWMRDHRVPPYDEASHTGLIRHVVIRVNREHQALVTLVINGNRIPAAAELADRLRPLGAVGLVLNSNTERTNVIFGRAFRTLDGTGMMHDRIGGFRNEVSPASFFQVNPVQTEVLYQAALDAAQLTGQELVTDLYCGAGTISLMLARQAKHVTGIEVVPQAVVNARHNAKANSVTNVDFIEGTAEQALPALVASGHKPDVIVVDPPRKGLDPSVIDTMLAVAPKRIVYVSCNPATLARDAALMVQGGYQISSVQPVDMFCFTDGVEDVVKFERVDG